MSRLPYVLIVAAMIQPSSALAQQTGYYVATPATVTKANRLTTRGTPWFARDTDLIAPRAPEKPAKVCSMLAGKVGPLLAFRADGQPFDADALATCNAAAPPPTVAAK